MNSSGPAMYYDDDPEIRFQKSLASETGKYQNTIGYNRHLTQWKTLGFTVLAVLGALWLFCSMTGISFDQPRVRSPHDGMPKYVSPRDQEIAERRAREQQQAAPPKRDAFDESVEFLRHLIK
ncbi:MAG: hypothetical protein ACR2NP_15025 [Pirellulaceae bacterium]